MVARTGPPEATEEKHEVYRRYLLARHDGAMSGSWEEFRGFLHEAPPFAREVVFRAGDRLVGAGIYDAGPDALSAVYFYFDPDLAARSPGTLNVLWLVEECRRTRRRPGSTSATTSREARPWPTRPATGPTRSSATTGRGARMTA